jgi:hypothetical protein
MLPSAKQAGALQERLNHTERDLAVAQHDAQAAQEAACFGGCW